MDILGIDIGTVSVKYVRCKNASVKNGIVSHGDYPYRGGFDDLNLILTDIRAKEGSDLEVVVGVTSAEITKKTFTIPVVPKKEQKETIRWAASKNLPIPIEDMVYEYLVLGQIEEKGIMKDEIFFMGAPKTYIDKIITVFRNAGFAQTTLITDIAFGYVHALGNVGDRSTAVIDIGGKRTGLYIANAKQLMFTREILTASESFSDALMSASALSFEQAERYKKEKGFEAEYSEILKIPFERLSGEIQRTFSVYNQRYPDQPITRIYLTGRGARMPKLFEKLEEALVEEVNYFDELQDVEDKFIPAHALCTDPDVFPNLMPESARKREQARFYKRCAVIGTFAVFAVLLLFSLFMWQTKHIMDIKVNIERKTSQVLKQQLSLLGQGTAKTFDAGEMAFIKEEIQKKDLTFIVLLKYLSSRIPKDVYLKSVEFGEEILPDAPLSGGQKTSGTAATDGKQQGPSQSQTTTSRQTASKDYYPLVLKGYIFGTPDEVELSFFNLVLSLKQSGFIDRVDIIGKEQIKFRGNPAVQFTVMARCLKYEL